MERDNLSKYNIIENYNDETIIGFYEDIVNYHKEVAKDYINTLDPTEYQSVIEVLELLQSLQVQYDRGELGDRDLLEIGYNPMGGYTCCQRVRESEL